MPFEQVKFSEANAGMGTVCEICHEKIPGGPPWGGGKSLMTVAVPIHGSRSGYH